MLEFQTFPIMQNEPLFYKYNMVSCFDDEYKLARKVTIILPKVNVMALSFINSLVKLYWEISVV